MSSHSSIPAPIMFVPASHPSSNNHYNHLPLHPHSQMGQMGHSFGSPAQSPAIPISTSKVSGTPPQRRPNEVFVGDLSYFCREQDLIDLFSQYGQVTNCHIVFNDDRTRSLMFGFITMATEEEARSVCNVLNSQIFMGRTMKVELLNEYKSRTESERSMNKTPSYLNGYQIHCSFVSSFPADRVATVPNEVFLRKLFCRFGVINDVIIREYTVHAGRHKQEGFGFVTFAAEESAARAAAECSSMVVENVYLKCKQSAYIAKPPKSMRQTSSPSTMMSSSPVAIPNAYSVRSMSPSAAMNAPGFPRSSMQASSPPAYGRESPSAYGRSSPSSHYGRDSPRMMNPHVPMPSQFEYRQTSPHSTRYPSPRIPSFEASVPQPTYVSSSPGTSIAYPAAQYAKPVPFPPHVPAGYASASEHDLIHHQSMIAQKVNNLYGQPPSPPPSISALYAQQEAAVAYRNAVSAAPYQTRPPVAAPTMFPAHMSDKHQSAYQVIPPDYHSLNYSSDNGDTISSGSTSDVVMQELANRVGELEMFGADNLFR